MPACSEGRSCGSGIGEVCRKDADNRRMAEGFAVGDPRAGPTKHGAGVLTGGNERAMPYTEQWKSWGKAPRTKRAEVLHLEARNLSRVVVHPKRAKLDCDAKLQVTTDGPLQVRLAGCHRSASFG